MFAWCANLPYVLSVRQALEAFQHPIPFQSRHPSFNRQRRIIQQVVENFRLFKNSQIVAPAESPAEA